MGIPWYIFSDAEVSAIKDVNAALTNIGILDGSQYPNVVFLPPHNNFESYLINEGYGDAIQTMLNHYHQKTDYLSDYKTDMDGKKAKGGVVRDYKSADCDIRAMIDILREGKTQYGLPIAQAITNLTDEQRRFPGKIRQLFEQVSDNLSLTKRVIQTP